MSISRLASLNALLVRTMRRAGAGIGKRATQDGATLAKTEKHIHDVKRGEASRSKDVHRTLVRTHHDNAAMLGERDQGSLSKYLGTLAAMSYGQQARFVNSMAQLNEDVTAIEEAVDGADELEAALVDLYSKDDD